MVLNDTGDYGLSEAKALRTTGLLHSEMETLDAPGVSHSELRGQ